MITESTYIILNKVVWNRLTEEKWKETNLYSFMYDSCKIYTRELSSSSVWHGADRYRIWVMFCRAWNKNINHTLRYKYFLLLPCTQTIHQFQISSLKEKQFEPKMMLNFSEGIKHHICFVSFTRGRILFQFLHCKILKLDSFESHFLADITEDIVQKCRTSQVSCLQKMLLCATDGIVEIGRIESN